MLCKEIMEKIENVYPKDAALSWDNVGLLAGRDDKEVRKIYVALDATDEVVEDVICQKADMLVTHHPLIFGGMKQINNRDFIGRRLLQLLGNDISYYAMHTNYDVLGMAELSEKILGIRNPRVLDVTMSGNGVEEGIGRVGDLEKTMTLEECSVYVKHRLKLGSLRVFGDMDRKVSRLAISPGSGKSVVGSAIAKGADVLVTGDIGHHDGLDAVEQGLSVIDAGHYGTEYIFIDDMRRFLEEKLPGLEVMAAPIIHPFQVV